MSDDEDSRSAIRLAVRPTFLEARYLGISEEDPAYEILREHAISTYLGLLALLRSREQPFSIANAPDEAIQRFIEGRYKSSPPRMNLLRFS
jgi:predicted ATPase